MADCCIFAGQGAQVPGMGKDFAESDSMLMDLFDKANGVLGFDLKKICFEGPAEELTKSNVCQPAIFVTSYAAFLAFQKRSSVSFAAAAGLSLGEWGALCAAGVLDFDSTLKVLEARGRFMQEACEAAPSGMIAIVGASPDQLSELCAKTGCTVANINSSAQQVLSGSKDEIAAAATVAKELGIKTETLRKTVSSSAIFTIAPAVAILIGVVALSKSLGLALPWLRLSVIGSITYETVAAGNALAAAAQTLDDGMPADMCVIDVNDALEHLGLITGLTVSTDIVNEIFANFCVGK